MDMCIFTCKTGCTGVGQLGITSGAHSLVAYAFGTIHEIT